MKTVPADMLMLEARRPAVDFDGAPIRNLRLPWPPSLNKIWRGKKKGQSGVFLSERALNFRRQASFAVSLARMARRIPESPVDGNVAVRLAFFPPDGRLRDLDNLPKSVFDALTHAHVWLDDQQVRYIESWFGPKVKSGAVVLSIAPVASPESLKTRSAEAEAGEEK